MVKIKYTSSCMYGFLSKEILNKGIDLKTVADELNVHRGTINRWLLKKEVPPQYFTQLIRLSKENYSVDLVGKENYKAYDMFFTSEGESKRLIDLSLKFITKNWKLDLKDYTLVEPSAGSGSFFKSFPSDFKSIALDLEPKAKNIKKMDFFDFTPNTKKNIVIGNPPFGLRGNLALRFINHSADWADFICFILPPLFNSNGKGSPMGRIDERFYLAKEFEIEDNNFEYPDGDPIVVNSIFQIWTKLASPKVKPLAPPEKVSEWIKILSLSNGKTSSSKRNVNMLDKCDLYLPSTAFGKFKSYKSFEELPNNRGYGVVYLKNVRKVSKAEKNIDWQKISFKSTNGANNLRTQLIIDAFNKEMENETN